MAGHHTLEHTSFCRPSGISDKTSIFEILLKGYPSIIYIPRKQRIMDHLFKSRFIIGAFLLLPLAFIALELVLNPLANPVKELLIDTGKAASRMLIFSLWLTPLKKFFPHCNFLNILQHHTRLIGLSVFGYVLRHFSFYIIEREGFSEIIEDLDRIFILCGLGSFIILVLMAVTSSNRMVRRLGAKKWKRLHQGVYAVAILVLAHMLLKKKTDPLEAWLLFLPLGAIEILRLVRWFFRGNAK